MPIYEFRCSGCAHQFELLVLNDEDSVEMKCPACSSGEFERVMSTTHHIVGGKAGGKTGVQRESRACSGGSCATYTVPGPVR